MRERQDLMRENGIWNMNTKYKCLAFMSFFCSNILTELKFVLRKSMKN